MLRKFLLLLILFATTAKAEIIENKKIINKSFDIWNISCEDDEMLNDIRCRLFVEITEKTTLFINPLSNDNKILIVSADGYYDRKFYIKIEFLFITFKTFKIYYYSLIYNNSFYF